MPKFLTVPLLVGASLRSSLVFLGWVSAWFSLWFGLVMADGAQAQVNPTSRFDYIDERLKDCMQIQGLDMDTCEEKLGREFDHQQAQTAKTFLEQLFRDKNRIRNLTPVPESQIPRLWSLIQSLPLDFHDESDGCWARAENISEALLSRLHIQSAHLKVAGHIRISPQYLPVEGVKLSWRYHIAPVILIQKDQGQLELRVIDPTLFPKTLPLAMAWLQRLEKESPGKLEYSLEQPQYSPASLHPTSRSYLLPDRSSPISQDLKDHLQQRLESSPIEFPAEVGSWASSENRTQDQEQIRRVLSRALAQGPRCIGTEKHQACAVYFLMPGQPIYCRWHLPLAQPESAELECFPYAR